MRISRRLALRGFLGCTALLGAVGPVSAQESPLSVAMLIPGQIDDRGFMEAGYNGLLAIRDELGADITHIDSVRPEQPLLEDALRELAANAPDLVIAHGGQNSAAAEVVAAEFPEVQFVVVQGGVTGPNLASYEILQEESAWLAGAAAGLLTETNIVGHISGIRVTPGLKGRGAFYNGLMHTNPAAEFLTIFAGDQDDSQLAYDVASAQIEAGADVIFTMLNAGRDGATEAMRENRVRHIGNVRDWTRDDPEVFVASAVADVSLAALEAARDLAEGRWEPGTIRRIGLENPEAVSLTLAPDVADAVVAEINALRDQMIADEVEVSTEYEGEEFQY